MNLGILERIEEKLNDLQGQLENMSSALEGMEKLKIEALELGIDLQELESNPPPPPPSTDKKGSGLFDDGGYEWDERIHAKTKKKTANGLWKKVRGCDKKLYDQIMAEQTINPSAGAPNPDKNAIDVPEVPTTPTAPTAPTAPTPPTAPTVEDDKQKAMASMSELTTRCGVPFDAILEQLPEGIKTFDSLPVNQHKDFAVKMKAWVDWLGMIHDENLKIQEMGGDEGIKGMNIIYGHYKGATHSNQISPENLPVVYDSIKEYREKWDAIQ